MRKASIAAGLAVLALTVAATAVAAPPRVGVLREGQSLGGVHIGWTRAHVISVWGRAFGRCRGCARETLYFNELPFQPQGVGVELRQGRVSAVFTLWSPAGWRTARGLRIGEPESRVKASYGALVTHKCRSYRALELPGRGVRTTVAIIGGVVWGFTLSASGEPVCR